MNEQKGIFYSKKKDCCDKKGKNYLFVVGIDKYQDNNIPNLQNPIDDISKISDILSLYYNFQLCNKLENDKASRASILEEITLLENKLTEDDNLILLFSGHGFKKGNRGFIVPFDGRNNSIANLISYDDLKGCIAELPMRHFLLILDCCYAGVASKDYGTKSEFKKSSRRILAACSPDETAEDGFLGKNSPFTRSLLKVLETNEKDELPIKTLFTSLRELMNLEGIRQVPVESDWKINGNEGGELILKKRKIEKIKVALSAEELKNNDVQNMQVEYSKLKYIKKEERLIALLQKYTHVDDVYKYEILDKIERLCATKKKKSNFQNYRLRELEYKIECTDSVKNLIEILSEENLTLDIKAIIRKKIEKLQKV